MKEYDAYLGNIEGLPDGAEIELTVRDLSPGRYKYEMKRVKAIVSRSPEKLPGADRLWLRFPMGDLDPEPWLIKIL